MAQSNVYSVNIVGYVNKDVPAASAFIANPLDNGTNDLNSILPDVPSKSTASLWTGSGFTTSTKTSAGWDPNAATPVGVGFFLNSKSAMTNTFVGNVIVGPGGSVTNHLPAGVAAVGSMIPYAGDLNNTNIALGVVPSKSTISLWNGSSYDTSTKTSAGWDPALQLNVGDGFFVNSKSEVDWIQTLPAN